MINAELDKLKEGTSSDPPRRSTSPSASLFSRRSRSRGREHGSSRSGRRRSRSRGGDVDLSRTIGSRRSRSRDIQPTFVTLGNLGRRRSRSKPRRRSKSPGGGSRARDRSRSRNKSKRRSRSRDIKREASRRSSPRSSRASRADPRPDLRDEMLNLMKIEQDLAGRRRSRGEEEPYRKPVHARLGPVKGDLKLELDNETMSEISAEDNLIMEGTDDLELSDLSEAEVDFGQDYGGQQTKRRRPRGRKRNKKRLEEYEKNTRDAKNAMNAGESLSIEVDLQKSSSASKRKIVVDKELAKAKEFKYTVRVGCKLETKPSLPEGKELTVFTALDEPTPHTMIEFESTAKTARTVYDELLRHGVCYSKNIFFFLKIIYIAKRPV